MGTTDLTANMEPINLLKIELWIMDNPANFYNMDVKIAVRSTRESWQSRVF